MMLQQPIKLGAKACMIRSLRQVPKTCLFYLLGFIEGGKNEIIFKGFIEGGKNEIIFKRNCLSWTSRQSL